MLLLSVFFPGVSGWARKELIILIEWPCFSCFHPHSQSKALVPLNFFLLCRCRSFSFCLNRKIYEILFWKLLDERKILQFSAYEGIFFLVLISKLLEKFLFGNFWCWFLGAFERSVVLETFQKIYLWINTFKNLEVFFQRI